MRQIELTRPYPPLADTSNRLFEERGRGGMGFEIWRAGYPDDVLAETIELDRSEYIMRILEEVWTEGVNYHPTVWFKDDLRAQAFAGWVAEQS
jgi:hypothetical protein